MINPYTYPIRGDLSRADVVALYREAIKSNKIFEFGIGGSTIFFGLADIKTFSFEDNQKWKAKAKWPIHQIGEQRNKPLPIEIIDIDYKEENFKVLIKEMIQEHNPNLYLVDCNSNYRGQVLDIVLENCKPQDVILCHDTRAPGPHKFITENLCKYFNKIDIVEFNMLNSNMTKIIVKEKLKKVDWNIEEKDNNRITWDDIYKG